MTPPTPEELLSLARKAWPDDAGYEHMIDVLQDEVIGDHPRALEALHAALKVLAGEAEDGCGRLGVMTQRLTPERERSIRADLDNSYSGDAYRDIRDLLAELDAIRAELADAEARGRQAERADVVAYLCDDGTGLYATEAIERGEHVGRAAKIDRPV